jgi:serine/threonine-protein kinase
VGAFDGAPLPVSTIAGYNDETVTMSNDPYIGLEIIGQFKIVQRIGKGGMGAVYKAEQPAMGRHVAVKILHRNLASRPDLVSRFRREARAMSRLTHPNTVRVFLYGQLENQALYIVMEYLEGLNLHQITKRQGPMALDRAARILIQCCGALEEAHHAGIIHRDLKPENILLTEQGGMTDFPKILDFGLAKVHDIDLAGSSPLTQEGMVFGTPEFMSPEQAKGNTLDSRSDLYSLGTILYEMITGKLPFEARNPADYIRHHIKSPPIPVTQRVPELQFPPELDAFFARVLAKERETRFQSANELAEALGPFAGNFSIPGRPPITSDFQAPGHAPSGPVSGPFLPFVASGPALQAIQQAPAQQAPAQPPVATQAPTQVVAPPQGPPKRASSTTLWIVIAVLGALVLVMGAAVVFLLLLLSRGGG